MAKRIGWICLHRKIMDCVIWESDEPHNRRSAWIELILMASHDDHKMLFDGHLITIKRGQILTSVRKLANRWHWGVQRTMDYLKLLEEMDMITRDSDRRRTLLTIVNYGVYNDMQNTDENTDRNTDENSDGTLTRTVSEHSQEHSQEHRPDTYNNKNNDNNELTMENNENNGNKKKRKEPTRSRYGEFQHVRLSDAEYQRLCEDYGDIETGRAIKKVDEYCERSGKRYDNYNLTLRKWGYEDDEKATKKPKEVKPKGQEEMQASYKQIMDWQPKGGLFDETGRVQGDSVDA